MRWRPIYETYFCLITAMFFAQFRTRASKIDYGIEPKTSIFRSLVGDMDERVGPTTLAKLILRSILGSSFERIQIVPFAAGFSL